MLSVSAVLDIDVPEAEVAGFDGVLIAAVRGLASAINVAGDINETTAGAVAGNLLVTATLTAQMSAEDLDKLISTVQAGIPTDATVVSGELNWGPAVTKVG